MILSKLLAYGAKPKMCSMGRRTITPLIGLVLDWRKYRACPQKKKGLSIFCQKNFCAALASVVIHLCTFRPMYFLPSLKTPASKIALPARALARTTGAAAKNCVATPQMCGCRNTSRVVGGWRPCRRAPHGSAGASCLETNMAAYPPRHASAATPPSTAPNCRGTAPTKRWPTCPSVPVPPRGVQTTPHRLCSAQPVPHRNGGGVPRGIRTSPSPA